jgi:hypothetical protein
MNKKSPGITVDVQWSTLFIVKQSNKQISR